MVNDGWCIPMICLSLSRGGEPAELYTVYMCAKDIQSLFVIIRTEYTATVVFC